MLVPRLLLFLCLPLFTLAGNPVPANLAKPDATPPSKDKPVKVYILSGQSNMVGIGQVSGGSSRWSGVTDAVVSVYEGAYDPKADYDKLKPTATKELAVYGGTKPTPFPGGGTQVVRGKITLKTSGIYEFRPGYQSSEQCIMELDGVEVHRQEPGKSAVRKTFKVEGGKAIPFKITFLTKDANGLGWFVRTDIPGTLTTLVKTEGKFPYLLGDDGNWAVRNDVWYKGLVTAGANKWLAPGCGAGNTSIGPELGFGHVLGTYHDEPVLVLKTSQGNRSLGWDFLPPGSDRFEHGGRIYAGYKDKIPSWTKDDPGKEVNWYAGKQYDECFEPAREVLAKFGEHFPQWKEQGFEVAGFAWWQGHKDGNEAHASRYEHNLVHLINTLRKEFDAPKAPFVVGTIGFGGWEMEGPHLTVAKAQLAVDGDRGKHPQFKGNVKTVETRSFWPAVEDSPRNQGFHYHGNAGTYLKVGEALGRGMVELLERASTEDPVPPLNPKGDVYKTEAENDHQIYDSTVGQKRMIVVHADFEDHKGKDSKETLKKLLGEDRFETMMRTQSQGRFELDITNVPGWRQMPNKKDDYETKSTEGHRKLFVDAFALFPELDFRNYDYIVISMPGKGNVAFGERDDLAIPYRGDKIRVALNITSNNPIVLAHELGHLMGLPDLYTYGDWKKEKKNPAGGWDIMSVTSRAGGFLGWHRHKFGWLAAERKQYLTEGDHDVVLHPLSAEEGVEMVVVPVDDPKHPSKVFVVELAQISPVRAKANEALAKDPGVLVYSVDATRETGQNPVVVYPLEGHEKDAPFHAGETFDEKDSPLTLKVSKQLEDGSYEVEISVK